MDSGLQLNFFLLPRINEWKKCRRSRLCNCRGGLVLIQMQFRVCSFDCVRVSLKSDWIRKQVVSRHESSTTLYMFLCKKGGFIERISRENLNNVCNRALATIMIRVFFCAETLLFGSRLFCYVLSLTFQTIIIVDITAADKWRLPRAAATVWVDLKFTFLCVLLLARWHNDNLFSQQTSFCHFVNTFLLGSKQKKKLLSNTCCCVWCGEYCSNYLDGAGY